MNTKVIASLFCALTTLIGCNHNNVTSELSELNEDSKTTQYNKITFEEFQRTVLESISEKDTYVDCHISQLSQDISSVHGCIATSFNNATPFYGFDRHSGVDTMLASASVMTANGLVTNWYYDEHCLPGVNGLVCDSFIKSRRCENPALRTVEEIHEQETQHQFEDRFFACSNPS